MEDLQPPLPSKEKIPAITIVGNAPEDIKKNIRVKSLERKISDIPHETGDKDDQMLERIDGDDSYKHMETIKIEKTPQEIKIINEAASELNQIRSRLGIEPFDISADNVVLFDSKRYKEGAGAAGFSSIKENFMAIPSKRRNNPIDFGGVVFHEMTHMKGFKALRVDKIDKVEITDEEKETLDEPAKNIFRTIRDILCGIKSNKTKEKPKKEFRPDIKINFHRSGLSAYAAERKWKQERGFFTGLEEAVAATMEGNFRKKLLDKLPPESIFDEETSYSEQRKVLNALTSGIYEKNKDKFKSTDEVLDIFIKSHFTGKLLPFCRLIKNTFGQEAFEKVATMSGLTRSATEALDSLKIAMAKEKIENIAEKPALAA